MKRPNKTAEPGGVWASSQFMEGGEKGQHTGQICVNWEKMAFLQLPLLLSLENGYKATDVEVLNINSGDWRDGSARAALTKTLSWVPSTHIWWLHLKGTQWPLLASSGTTNTC